MSLILPQSTVNLINAVADGHRHPGLQLDKFSIPGDQTAQNAELTKVCNIPGDPSMLTALLERRRRLLPEVTWFSCTTTGPLTLHLARASALENAGICLHPLYGFAYLPGSGLKGMARAYAKTVACASEEDILAVFGNEPGETKQAKQHAGNIVFHDAWPESWPQLIVDIVNNHHPDYYQNDDNNHPPGDWENPVPVYFLAVKPPVTFMFLLAKRRADVASELLDLARQWLLGALCHLGAGAKTAAGYGAFKPAAGEVPALPTQRRATFETTLELVTPAFLAGANKQADDCDLRPATLRGQLRWWWRTMHAGFVDVKTLRALEAAIWGNTNQGGPVRLTITAKQTMVPVLFDRQAIIKQCALPMPPDKKTTQGLTYHSFGMDEKKAGVQVRRHFLEPGTKWAVELTARPSQVASPGNTGQIIGIGADVLLDQAKAALALLCHFGGVGAKGRNGFGSLSMTESLTLDEVKQLASTLRKQLGRSDCAGPASELSSLEHLLSTGWIATPWKNYWFVLDQLGFSIQAFCQADGRKRAWIKEALGLPRKIGESPHDGSHDRGYTRTFDKQTKQEVVWLGQKHPYRGNRDSKDMRHASPIHCHLRRDSGGTYAVQVVAFPCSILPDASTSSEVLKALVDHVDKDLSDRVKRYANRSQSPAPPVPSKGAASQRQQAPSPSAGPSLPRPGERVEAVLLEEKTRKGGWRAQHVTTGIAGPIQNSGDVPGDKKAGDTVTLIVQSANEREIAFRYPTAADEQRAPKLQGKPKGDSRDRRPPRRR